MMQSYKELNEAQVFSETDPFTKVLGSGQVSRFLGQYFPWLRVYGSYLVIANKVR